MLLKNISIVTIVVTFTYRCVFGFSILVSVGSQKCSLVWYTGLSKKMDGIWNRYNLKSTGRIYTFGVLKCSEKFKVLDFP